MAVFLLLNWWYTSGWANSFKAILLRSKILANDLSVPILFKTLFEPWKQIKLYSGQSSSLDLKLHIFAENIFSRFFGFFVRLFVIIFGLLTMLVVTIFGIILAIIWPVIPLLPLIYIYMAVTSL